MISIGAAGFGQAPKPKQTEEIHKCEGCGQENLESELEEDDYAQYVGFSEELNCPNCKAVVQ